MLEHFGAVTLPSLLLKNYANHWSQTIVQVPDFLTLCVFLLTTDLILYGLLNFNVVFKHFT